MTNLSITQGLNYAQQTMNALATNVANASTPGYRSHYFSANSMFSESPNGVLANPGSGMIGDFSQGGIINTGNPLNAAINGLGFFRLTSGDGEVSYTRAGEFMLGKEGFLQSVNGSYVTGYQCDGKGNVLPGLGRIALNQSPLQPSATKTATMAVNLAGKEDPPKTTPFNPDDPTSYTNAQSVVVYDQAGAAHTLQTYYVASSTANTYDLKFSVDGKEITPSGSTQLKFNDDGTLTSTSPTTIALDIPGGSSSFPISLDVSKTTQFGTAFQSVSVSQDGYPMGNFSYFDFGQDGKIMANYSNGQSVTMGQVALANFVNPQGLAETSGGLFLESAASGQPTVGAPGSGAFGVLQPSSLESSNVDLATAMVDMITAQRDYQANAQSVKIYDQNLQTLVNLR
jgi:flagellar hook protein FlgE